MTVFAVELARTDVALRALAAEWDALHRRVPDATPFQSPTWLLPWWQVFGTGSPRLAALRGEAGRLMGLLPLYVLDEPAERKLLPIGAGTTDYLDLLLDPLAPADAAQRLLDAALAKAAGEGVTACDLIELPPGSKLRDVVAPTGWRQASTGREPCTVLTLPPGARRLGEVIPSGKLSGVRLARNRAARAGGWVAETARAESFHALFGKLIRMHQDRWREAGEPGLFADPRVAEFHRAAASQLLARKMLRLDALRIGGRVAAAYYLLIAGERILFYLCGFDRAFARESPGTILMAAIIERALAEGDWRELHFLRGAETFKRAWGAEERMNLSRRLVPCCG